MRARADVHAHLVGGVLGVVQEELVLAEALLAHAGARLQIDDLIDTLNHQETSDLMCYLEEETVHLSGSAADLAPSLVAHVLLHIQLFGTSLQIKIEILLRRLIHPTLALHPYMK